MGADKRADPSPRWPTVILLGVIVFLASGPCTGGVVKIRQQSRTVACSNNLKQLGLAAQMYLNDHGVFPHNPGEANTEEDVTFGYGEQIPPRGHGHIQLMFDGGYIDDPEVAVCPASKDVPAALDPDGRYVLGVIGGQVSNCSYLWARAPLTGKSPDSAVLGACSLDHKGGRNVLFVSGDVEFVPGGDFEKEVRHQLTAR